MGVCKGRYTRAKRIERQRRKAKVNTWAALITYHGRVGSQVSARDRLEERGSSKPGRETTFKRGPAEGGGEDVRIESSGEEKNKETPNPQTQPGTYF